jgi:hypothetical protein
LVKEKIKQVYLARVTRIGKENSGRLNKGSSQHNPGSQENARES